VNIERIIDFIETKNKYFVETIQWYRDEREESRQSREKFRKQFLRALYDDVTGEREEYKRELRFALADVRFLESEAKKVADTCDEEGLQHYERELSKFLTAHSHIMHMCTRRTCALCKFTSYRKLAHMCIIY
jgi:hypothetical protein